MAFTWALDDATYDLSISKGKLVQVSGADEVKQRILVTLWHYWREYFLNVPGGVPWYELILGSKDKRLVESLLRKIIFDVPGVVSIVRFGIQSPLGYLRDFAIFIDVEVTAGIVSLIVTPPAMASGNYITTDSEEYLLNSGNVYLTT